MKLNQNVVVFTGGFVSVPPCLAAKHLGISVFTHECDFTLGLANKINFKSAKNIFASYEDTKKHLRLRKLFINQFSFWGNNEFCSN